MKITEILGKKFTYSVEMVPPRNWEEPETLYARIGEMKELGVDFISVTKGAGGSLRGGTLPIAYFAKERYGLECIAHFTSMDSTKQEIENSLKDYYQFGIENLLALRGDAPDMAPGVAGECPEHKGDYDYAYQLIHQISELGKGHYLPRKGFDKEEKYKDGPRMGFCIGAAAHPEDEDMEKSLDYFEKKVSEGAHYAITQMIFDVELYKKFVAGARERGVEIPVLPGVRPLTKHKQAVVTETKFGVPVPDKFKDGLDGLEGDAAYAKGIELTAELCRELKNAGAPGVHLFVMNNVDMTKDILGKLRE